MPPLHEQVRLRDHASLVGYDAAKRMAWNIAKWYELCLLANPFYLWMRFAHP